MKTIQWIAFILVALCISVSALALAQSQDATNAHNQTTVQQYEDGLHLDEANRQLVYVQGSDSKTIPLWLSLFPPLIAIGLALAFKEVHVALISGIFFGVFLINGASFLNIFESIFQIADTYIIQTISPSDGGTGHVSIIVFSMLIGGMVSVISSNGGMKGIVAKVSKIATSARRAQLATWLMGLIIFFDDYANTLVVGNTMRPLSDKYKVSREKLAYLVDSTAAPIAAIGLVTTWIGYQLSEITKGIEAQSYIPNDLNAYGLFIGSLQYAYYPILTIFFVLFLIVSKRAYGPMKLAEEKALTIQKKAEEETEETINEDSKPNVWLNAALPIVTLVLTVFIGIYYTGSAGTETAEMGLFASLRAIVGNSNSYVALLWASFAGSLVAILVTVVSRSMSLKDSIESYIEGLKSMVPAVVILVLAWSLAMVIEQLHTADFLKLLVPDTSTANWLPFIFFILAALISFSTGSSWSTMAIMYPLCIPLVLGLATADGTITDTEAYMPVLLNTISVILAASVFGDHCSPISDTTILSSLASDCDHIAHVRTQMPYALTVGGISLLCGGVLFAIGIPWYINFVIGIALVYAVVRFVGKPIKY